MINRRAVCMGKPLVLRGARWQLKILEAAWSTRQSKSSAVAPDSLLVRQGTCCQTGHTEQRFSNTGNRRGDLEYPGQEDAWRLVP